jgi:hypothetical protein
MPAEARGDDRLQPLLTAPVLSIVEPGTLGDFARQEDLEPRCLDARGHRERAAKRHAVTRNGCSAGEGNEWREVAETAYERSPEVFETVALIVTTIVPASAALLGIQRARMSRNSGKGRKIVRSVACVIRSLPPC